MSWSSLSQDILIELFDTLEPSSFYSARRVCSHWRSVSDIPRVKESLLDAIEGVTNIPLDPDASYGELAKDFSLFFGIAEHSLVFRDEAVAADHSHYVNEDGIIEKASKGKGMIKCHPLDNDASLFMSKRIFWCRGHGGPLYLLEPGRFAEGVDVLKEWKVLRKLELPRAYQNNMAIIMHVGPKVISLRLYAAPFLNSCGEVLVDTELKKMICLDATHRTSSLINGVFEHVGCIAFRRRGREIHDDANFGYVGNPQLITKDYTGAELLSYWEYLIDTDQFWLCTYEVSPLDISGLFTFGNKILKIEGMPGPTFNQYGECDEDSYTAVSYAAPTFSHRIPLLVPVMVNTLIPRGYKSELEDHVVAEVYRTDHNQCYAVCYMTHKKITGRKERRNPAPSEDDHSYLADSEMCRVVRRFVIDLSVKQLEAIVNRNEYRFLECLTDEDRCIRAGRRSLVVIADDFPRCNSVVGPMVRKRAPVNTPIEPLDLAALKLECIARLSE